MEVSVEQMRALIAVLIRGQDGPLERITHTLDHYLQQAQYLLESSYKNYTHPAGVDPDLVRAEMKRKLEESGYVVIPPTSSTA